MDEERKLIYTFMRKECLPLVTRKENSLKISPKSVDYDTSIPQVSTLVIF